MKDQIKLVELEIENFGPFYKNDHKIEFSYENKLRNITLIEGIIGRGKTTIFQLIYWIIYGDERHLWSGKKGPRGHQLKYLRKHEFIHAINGGIKKELDQFKVGGKLKFQRIEDGRGKFYLIERYRHYKQSKSRFSEVNETLNIFKEGEKVSGSQESFLRSLFPANVRDFILIHGESLDRKLQKIEHVKNYAMNLSDYPTITRTQKVLERAEKWASNYLKKEQSHDLKLNKLNEERDNLVIDKDFYEKRIAELKTEIETAEDIINGKSEEMARLGEEDENANKLKVLQIEKLMLQNEIKNLEEQRSEALRKNLPIILLESTLLKCKEDLRQKKNKGLWPNRITMEVVNDVLALDTCLGIEWTEKNKRNVEEFMKHLPPSSTEGLNEVLQKFDIRIEQELNKIEDYKREIKKAQHEYEQVISQLNDSQSKIDDLGYTPGLLKEQIDRNKKIRQLADEIADIRVRQNQFNRTTETFQGKILDAEAKIEKIEQQIKKQSTTKGKTYNWDPVKDKILIMEEIIEEIEEEFEKQIKIKVETMTTDVFKSMIPDAKSWDKIEVIDEKDGWDLSYYRSHKGESYETKNLSTGQASLLSLAYIIALNSLLDILMPLVYDSMFVNLSREEKIRVAEILPKFYQGGQIIIFAKDSELEGIREKISDFIGKNYRLKFIAEKMSFLELINPIQYSKKEE